MKQELTKTDLVKIKSDLAKEFNVKKENIHIIENTESYYYELTTFEIGFAVKINKHIPTHWYTAKGSKVWAGKRVLHITLYMDTIELQELLEGKEW